MAVAVEPPEEHPSQLEQAARKAYAEALKALEKAPQQRQQEAQQQLQVTWRGIPPRVIMYGVMFGLIKLGYTLKDYLIEAAGTPKGYETVGTWAERGAGKSNQMLTHGYWIYGDWDLVLKRIVFRPSTFVKTLRQVPQNMRLPWLGWDDIGVHFPSSTFRTDIKAYEAIDATWASIRTKATVIDVSIPLIDRFAKNIKDSLSFEMFMGKNQTILIERLVRLPNIKDRMESNLRKVQVEPIHQIDLYKVPSDVFQQYWQMRIGLADEALEKLDNVLTRKELLETRDKILDFIPMAELRNELTCSPTTITTLMTQKMIRTKLFDGILHIHREDITYLKQHYGKQKALEAHAQ